MPTIGSKSQVYKGLADHTSGGLKKHQIKRIPVGDGTYRYVSAKKSAMMSKGNTWVDSVTAARKELKFEGFVKIKKGAGATADEKALYNLAKKKYEQSGKKKRRSTKKKKHSTKKKKRSSKKK